VTHRHAAASAVARVLDFGRIDALLAPWVPDARERAWVTRCILDEGPAHHRGANYAILALLGRLVEAGGPVAPADRTDASPITLRLPPHLAPPAADGHFPLGVPRAPVALLAPKGSPELESLLECLGDGPPQHALANAAMVHLLGVLLERAGLLRS
jgi:hypothetical protein